MCQLLNIRFRLYSPTFSCSVSKPLNPFTPSAPLCPNRLIHPHFLELREGTVEYIPTFSSSAAKPCNTFALFRARCRESQGHSHILELDAQTVKYIPIFWSSTSKPSNTFATFLTYAGCPLRFFRIDLRPDFLNDSSHLPGEARARTRPKPKRF